MTNQDIIYQALTLIGVIGSGETPSTEETADGLTGLTRMLDNWSGVELIVPATRTESITLFGFQPSYTFAGPRPTKIISADVLTGGMTFPVAVLGPDAWAQMPDKNDATPRPRALYCDYGFPFVSVQFAPIPNGGATARLYCVADLAAIVNLFDIFSLPHGYQRAVTYNLAVDLASEYERAVPASVQAIADKTLAGLIKLHASNRAGKSELEVPPAPPAGA